MTETNMTATIDDSTTTASTGRIARVIGPVVDIEFPSDAMPDIYNALTVDITLGDETNTILLEVAQHIGDGIDLSVADIAAAADMANNVLRADGVVVDQCEVADARHGELERHARAARAASRYEDLHVREQRDVEQGLDTLEGAIVHGASAPSDHVPVLRHLA